MGVRSENSGQAENGAFLAREWRPDMFGGCGQAELSVESLFFKFICGIHLVPETKMPPLQWMTNAIGKDYAYVARVLRLTLLGDRPRRPDGEPAGGLQRGQAEAGAARAVVGAEETTRHRVISKTGGRE